MTLSSMTGYAHVDGAWGDYQWSWELRSVNGKGLDLRFRLPPGMEALDSRVRKLATERLSRGNVNATLDLSRRAAGTLSIDEDALDSLVKSAKRAAKKHGLKKPRVEDLLGVKGMITIEEPALDAAEVEDRDDTLASGFVSALDQLIAMRDGEGTALTDILSSQLESVGTLIAGARNCDAAMPEAIKARLADQIAELVDRQAMAGDQDRIAQEAAYLAVKADVREELDRLDAHVAAARELIANGSPAGRKLDFLAQEFSREANTLCSKAADAELTRIGLELKAVIDQMREQIQNVE